MRRLLRRLVGILRESRLLHRAAVGGLRHLHEPTITCRKAVHGTEYGGWTVCPEGLSAHSIVYSFGVGEDASFDLSMIETYGANVYAFDPTPRSIEWVRARDWPPQFHFHPLGLADREGSTVFYPPENPDHISHTILDRPGTADRAVQVEMRRLETICEMLAHKRIDVLKMDIEGAEYSVITDITNTSVEIGQILVEFHHFFSDIGTDETFAAVHQLRKCGYEIFHISPSGHEYGFLRVSCGCPE